MKQLYRRLSRSLPPSYNNLPLARSLVRRGTAPTILLLWLLLAAAASAQQVGTIAALEGSARIGHGGVWTAAVTGAPISLGDTLRTGIPGRLRIVFQDDSVLTMADDSEITVDTETFDSSRGVARALLRLVKGKVRALVSEYYERPGSQFQIETVTAVSGVRGTEFIITYDPVADASDVVGVSGRVEVHSTADRVGHPVFITAQEITTVVRGKYPTPARRLDDEAFRQYLAQLEFPGEGKAESFVVTQPLLTGAGVPDADRAAVVPGPGVAPTLAEVARSEHSWAGSVVPSVSGETAHETVEHTTASGIIQQPPAVLEGTQGRVGIHF